MAINKTRVLVAGIGGASLGTEIIKCLMLESDSYHIIGCDISPLAYGHYESSLNGTYRVDVDDYVPSILSVCEKEQIEYILPGGERPLTLLTQQRECLAQAGIKLLANNEYVTETFSDKHRTFRLLRELGFETPLTRVPDSAEDLASMPYPCVVKPATGSGGSDSVFLAADQTEAEVYVKFLRINGKTPIVQEYISSDEGEFTVGVLSDLSARVIGSLAMKRLFHTKLSIFSKTEHGLISSGYSQGLIDDFPHVCDAAEKIAVAVKSQGPINIQARIRDGILIPFEINPRFSASTYLRAMAGFNEIHYYLQHSLGRVSEPPRLSRPGYYLRSLSEQYIPVEDVIG